MRHYTLFREVGVGSVFCGVSLDAGDAGRCTSAIEQVTCPACAEIIASIGSAYQAMRRRRGAPSSGNVVEELGEGDWKHFDMAAWRRQPPGQYDLTIRVVAGGAAQAEGPAAAISRAEDASTAALDEELVDHRGARRLVRG